MERFERNIKSRLSHMEVQPPDFIWDEIESRLDHNPGFTAIWYKLVASISLLFISMSAAIFYFSISFVDPEMVVDNTIENTYSLPLPNEFAYINASSTPLENEIDAHLPQEENLSAFNTLLALQEIDALRQTERKNHQKPQFQAAQVLLADTQSEDFERIVNEILDDIYLEMEVITAIEAQLNLSENTANVPTTQSSFSKTTDIPVYDVVPEPTPSSLNYNANDFTLSAFFSPLQSFRYQGMPGQFNYENVENGLISYALGLNAGVKINSRLEFQAGIAYSRLGQRIEDIDAFAHPGNAPVFAEIGQNGKEHPQQLSTSMGDIKFTNENFYFASSHSSRILTQKGSISNRNVSLLTKAGVGLTQQFSYVEVPFMLRYRLIDRSFSVGVKAGVSANMLISGDVYLSDMGRKDLVGQSTNINTLNFSGTGGLILSYPLNPNFSVNMEPSFNMFLNPIASDMGTSGKTYPYNYSVLMGISYGF